MLSLQEYGKSDGKYENIQLFEFNVKVSNTENASLNKLFVFFTLLPSIDLLMKSVKHFQMASLLKTRMS